jgi:hypothetical protein
MYARNVDTGKWFKQTDSLRKDVYDNLRQDLDRVRLYSKCLSGATYLPIKSFNNIYDTLDIEKIGYYINEPLSNVDLPQFNVGLPLNSSIQNEFYNKYLTENAFTIKNLFTPTKLIKDQIKNYFYVDVATVAAIDDLSRVNPNFIIDGVKLVEGNLVLVKNQGLEVNVPATTDPEDYFTNVNPVAKYTFVSNNVSTITYFYNDNTNGIYRYTENKLVKTTDLDTYEDVYRYSIVVGMGDINREKQFHLARLKNGYYPVSSEGDNIFFEENKNWILRNRVDYNNIFDLNYYDILNHGTQSFYDELSSITYSIVERTIAIGEFGIIINNQDKLNPSATYSISNIINNKFKVNLRSIDQVTKYYWICGDEGTLLRVNKSDYSIRRVILDETVNFMSVSFFDDLNGMVVGKFNTIYYTRDGGINWTKLVIPEFEGYSYNKVVFYSLTKAYIGGESGVFLELTAATNNWQSYKRKISRIIDSQDEFILVDDINDMAKTNWVTLSGSYSTLALSSSFADSLQFSWKVISGMRLKITIDSKYFGNPVFDNSNFYVAISIGFATIYTNPKVIDTTPTTPFADYDFYQFGSNKKTELIINLPSSAINPLTGNLNSATYSLRANMFFNYDDSTNSVSQSFVRKTFNENVVVTKNADLLLISGNNDAVVLYDINNEIYDKSNFIYLTSTQSVSDVKTIGRKPNGRDVFIGGDKIYKFDISQFLDFGTISNFSNGSYSTVVDYHVNKLYLTDQNVYLAGNNSLLRFDGYNSSNYPLLDPTFDGKLRSKLLFLDYDVASKLNFFDDSGQYRLANSVSFPTASFVATFSIDSFANEYNWLDYYKDSEKTFRYYSSFSDNNKVEFSTTFSFASSNTFTFSSSEISINLNDILPFAPNINIATSSRFILGSSPINTGITTNFRILMYKYLIIFKNIRASVGDVLRMTSPVIDVELVVNRILNVTPNNSTRYQLFYCYSDFNDNIIRNIRNLTSIITVTNLNRYTSYSNLISNFENHPASIGYRLVEDGNNIKVEQRFNNKTSYYNMQSTVILGTYSQDMKYEESFLNFGYSPTYNILDYLNKIDPVYFNTNSVFSIMPRYYGVPGNSGGTFTQSNVFIDLLEGQQSGTYSYYRYGTNKVMFGSDFRFHWESLLIHTFIDLEIGLSGSGTFLNERMLIVDKYFDSVENGYVIEFHKKIQTPNQSFVDVDYFNFISRNSLGQISADLQLLNNIQRTRTTKSLISPDNFSGLENELMYKFPTDSYFKVLASDFRIRKLLSAIIYTDYKSEIAMGVLNLDEEKKYKFINSVRAINYGGFANDKLQLQMTGEHDLKVGDLIRIEFDGGTGSSQFLNQQYFGLHTVLSQISAPGFGYIITSLDYGSFTNVIQDSGVITILRRDPFFNYIPVDLIELGVDERVKRAIEIRPENIQLTLSTWNLIDVDLNRYRYQFVDGLSLDEVSNFFPWFLEAEVTNAIIGRDDNGLVWYSGDWLCGRWFGGTWYSGRWVSGDWYAGLWSSYNSVYKAIRVDVDKSYSSESSSKWFGGRWFDGTWDNGTWYNGRRYAGDWNNGVWFNGIWNDGNWKRGTFKGGVWVLGKWESGVFNTDAKPSYWLDGEFKSGDFENGIWYNGQFGNIDNVPARFGTKSSNSRNSVWHGGKWISGEFHSIMNKDSDNNNLVSEIHKYSIWRTGVWLKGDFWGGIAYNIDFRSGTWHGGILEEIQVTGVDKVYPANSSNNAIILNGDFRFNIGDEIWILDDERGYAYSPIGNNDSPKKYRINKVEELDNKKTRVYLNYNLSSLGISQSIGAVDYFDVETGLRVVSYFKNSRWESGIWTNGIFEDGQFDSGIWFNGIFAGTWGN